GATTRAVVATVDGSVVSRGQAGDEGYVHEHVATAGEIFAALRQALAAVDPARVRTALLGLAGLDAASGGARVRAALDEAWRHAGLSCPYTQVDEALIAFAAGTPWPDGTVLVAGDGAMAASVRGRRLHRLADGHGWLLGDE